MFSKGIKATIEGTGNANWAILLWNMSHGSQQLCKLQWLKDTIWWLMSTIAWRFNSILTVNCLLQHMIHLGHLTNSPLSWKYVLRCHCPGPPYLWCYLNEAIVPHKQFNLLWLWMDEREIRLPENPHQLSPNLFLRQSFCGPANFKPGLSKRESK